MIERKFKGVVFDFDGTLADTFPGIYSAWKETFERLGLDPISQQKVKEAIGPTRDVYLKMILGEKYANRHEEALNLFKDIYKSSAMFSTNIYEGIPELLDSLDDAGIRMGIASNKPYLQLVKLLAHFNLSDCFCPVLGPEKVKEGKPAPDMLIECAHEWGLARDRIILAGDNELDLMAGRNAGISCAAVLWGYSNESTLSVHNPEYIVASPASLLELILKTPNTTVQEA